MAVSLSKFNFSAPAVILLAGMSLSGCNRENHDKPNFLVILTDDLTYRAIGYNNELIKTPFLDKLARKGIIFNRAYISSPVCAASRASLLTGLFPQTNGTVALDTKSFIRNIVQEKKFKTLPQFLNEAGYTSYFSGKSHLGDPKDYGFQYGKETPDYDDKTAFEDVNEYIDSPEFGQNPFLLWLAVRQPHVPLKPEEKWLDIYSKTIFPIEKNFLEKPPAESFYNQGLPGEHFYRDSDYSDNYKNLPAGPPRSIEVIREFTKAYYATISHLDFQIGELMKRLESKNQLENTVVIFLSDNGYFLGNHGLGNKLTMHEEAVRVPMFICWDRLRKGDIRCDALVSSVDIMPTILDLAGIEIPGHLQGKSAKILLSYPDAKIHEYVASESVGVGGETGSGHTMVIKEKMKYILSDAGDEALYNLQDDLYELDNLVNDPKYLGKVSELKSCLTDWKRITDYGTSIPGEPGDK
jgi:arylsulfatase A-like enzyme